MGRDIVQNPCKRADAQCACRGTVTWCSLAVVGLVESHVASQSVRDRIPTRASLRTSSSPDQRVAVSNGDDLFASEVGPHDVWHFTRFEVGNARHRARCLPGQRSRPLSVKIDSPSARAVKSAFGSFLDEKDDLVHADHCTEFDARTPPSSGFGHLLPRKKRAGEKGLD